MIRMGGQMFILSTFNQGQLTTSQSAGAVKNHILMDNKQNMETLWNYDTKVLAIVAFHIQGWT